MTLVDEIFDEIRERERQNDLYRTGKRGAVACPGQLRRSWHHPYIGTEHLLLALQKVFTGVAGQVLAMNRVDEERHRAGY